MMMMIMATVILWFESLRNLPSYNLVQFIIPFMFWCCGVEAVYVSDVVCLLTGLI